MRTVCRRCLVLLVLFVAACGETQSLTEEPRVGPCRSSGSPSSVWIGVTRLIVNVRSERDEPIYAAIVITEQLFETGRLYDSLPPCGTDRDGSCWVGYSFGATAPMNGWNPVRITVKPPRAYSVTTVNDSAFYSFCPDSTARIIQIVVPDTAGHIQSIMVGSSL